MISFDVITHEMSFSHAPETTLWFSSSSPGERAVSYGSDTAVKACCSWVFHNMARCHYLMWVKACKQLTDASGLGLDFCSAYSWDPAREQGWDRDTKESAASSLRNGLQLGTDRTDVFQMDFKSEVRQDEPPLRSTTGDGGHWAKKKKKICGSDFLSSHMQLSNWWEKQFHYPLHIAPRSRVAEANWNTYRSETWRTRKREKLKRLKKGNIWSFTDIFCVIHILNA